MSERGFSVRLSASVDQYVASMKRAQGATEQFSASASANFRKAGDDMQRAGGVLTRNVTLPVVAAGAGMVKASLDWESSFAGVAKTVNGTAVELERLEGQLRAMARSMPATHGEIAAVAEAAGQLGVATADIADFTETMIQLGTATNLSADEAATSIAQMMNVMGTAPADVDRLGAALVALGNNGASTERDIVQMSQRIAGAGNVIGLTEPEVLGLANALASVGIETEAGGSSISTTMIKIAAAVEEGGAKLSGFAEVAGMSSEAFSTAFRDTPAAAITEFVAGLGRLEAAGGNVFGTLEQLGLSDIRVRDALMRMAGAGDLLRDSIELGNKAFEDGTALTDEYGKRAETSAAKLQVLWNQIVDVGIELGDVLVPVLLDVVGAVSDLVTWFGNLPEPVQQVALGLLAVAAAAGPLLTIGGSLVRNFMLIQSTFKSMSAAMMAHPWIAVAGLAATAVGVLTMASGDGAEAQAELQARSSDVATALDTEVDSIIRLAAESGEAVDPVLLLASAQDALNTALLGSDAEADKFRTALGTLGLTADDTTEMFRILSGMNLAPTGDEYLRFRNLTIAMLEAKGVSADMAEVLAGVAGSMLVQGQSAETAAEGAGELTAEQRALVDAMIVLAGAAEDTDFNKIASEYLNLQYAAGGLTQELVAQAEAQVGASRNGADAAKVYDEYLRILSTLTPEQMRLVAGLDGTADAHAGAGEAVEQHGWALRWWRGEAKLTEEELKALEEQLKREKEALQNVQDALADTSTYFADLAREAGYLEDALDAVFGGPADLERATRQWQAGVDDLTESFKDNGLTLDQTTEKGRANRAAIEEQLGTIRDWGVAMVENGATTEEAANTMNFLTEALVNQAKEAGFSEEEIRSYLEALGMTPENIDTAVNLAFDAKQKAELETILGDMETLDEGVAAEIEALIDAGSFEEARRLLDDLEKPRSARVRIYSSGVPVASAEGRYVPAGANLISTFGEKGPEAILPLDNMMRMRELLSDPRIAGPVAAAVGQSAAGGAPSGGGGFDWASYERSMLLDQFVVNPVAPETPNVSGQSNDQLMQNRYERGDLSAADYDAWLAEKQAGLEKFSEAEHEIWQERQRLIDDERRAREDQLAREREETRAREQLAEDEKRAREDALQHERDVMRARFELGDISVEEYRAFLDQQIAETERFGPEFMGLWREIESVRADEAAAQQARVDAIRRADEEANQRHLDTIEAQFEAAARRREANEAAREADAAVGDLSTAADVMAWVANNPDASDADRARATADLERAKERAADALLRRADALANQAGMDDGTVPWAIAVRTALLADAVNAPALAEYINRVLAGVPQFAHGGHVAATAGGVIGRLAERGSDEWIFNNPQLQSMLNLAASQPYHGAVGRSQGPQAASAAGDTYVEVYIDGQKFDGMIRSHIQQRERHLADRLLAGAR